jgi:hypothetical protein
MSEPPIITATELQRLDEEVDGVRAQLRALAERYEVQVGMIAALEARLPEPAGRLRPGIGNSFAENASSQDMDELIGWVDWLIATYDLIPARQIKPCWLHHSGVVEELAALRAAWVEAAGKGGSEMATWHGLYLAGMLARLESTYLISRCRPDKCEQPSVAAPTRRPGDQ